MYCIDKSSDIQLFSTDLGFATAISTDIEGVEGNVQVALGGRQDVEQESKVNIGDEAMPLDLKKRKPSFNMQSQTIMN